MARRYFDELQELAGTYASIADLGDEVLQGVARAQRAFNQRPSFFFGSGGAIALAHLAAMFTRMRASTRRKRLPRFMSRWEAVCESPTLQSGCSAHERDILTCGWLPGLHVRGQGTWCSCLRS